MCCWQGDVAWDWLLVRLAGPLLQLMCTADMHGGLRRARGELPDMDAAVDPAASNCTADLHSRSAASADHPSADRVLLCARKQRQLPSTHLQHVACVHDAPV